MVYHQEFAAIMVWKTQKWLDTCWREEGLTDIVSSVMVVVFTIRIERLWAELNPVVSFHFSNLLTFMENHGVLDSTNEFLMFCLHLIYLPRIQRAAAEFRAQWNNHGLSTQRGQTPLQLWQTSVLGTAGFPNRAIDVVFQIDGDFGVEDDGPLPCNGKFPCK